MTAQLRIYDIRPGMMDEFAALVAEHVFPAREQYGFRVLGPWITKEANQYVWIVSYEGELPWDEAVDVYYNSPVRSSIPFDPKDYIESADLRLIEPI